ncbi:MAG: hypothetical protein FWB97_06610, partial [Oscillospiraceae bacterium]|nr:hypothetical protein [Oscillospiraceae bacterium]
MKTKKIMALLLAAVLMLALIAACGNGAADPAPTPQPGVTDPATPPVGTDDDGDEDENGEDAPPPP